MLAQCHLGTNVKRLLSHSKVFKGQGESPPGLLGCMSITSCSLALLAGGPFLKRMRNKKLQVDL